MRRVRQHCLHGVCSRRTPADHSADTKSQVAGYHSYIQGKELKLALMRIYTSVRWRVSLVQSTLTKPSLRSSKRVIPQFPDEIHTGFSSGASRAPIKCSARMQMVPV